MVRWERKRIIMAVVAIAAALMSTMFTKSAHGAQSTSKYYPDLLQNWGIGGPINHEGNSHEYVIGLLYGGGEFTEYRQLGKADNIPAMWTKLYLPSGMQLMKAAPYKSRFSDTYYRSYYHKPVPKTNLRWQKGLPPTWKVLNVNQGVLPRVAFWITGQPGQCFSATTQGMYRHHKRWVRIPHAPLQHAQACLPGAPPPTTTTTG